MNGGRVLNLDDINDYITNEFFIIDSENLNSINSRLFGFSIYDGNIVYDKDLNDNIQLNGDGTYVRILNAQNKIQISQDFNGNYGIYLYKHQDIFVVSNSFLKLVDYVKDKYPISLNEDVAYSLMAFDLCSLAYKQV